MARKSICICGKIVEGSVSNCICKKRTRVKTAAEIERNKVLTTTNWRNFRKSIIQRDGAVCQRCLIKYQMINSSSLEVHHVKPRINYPELTFERSNCVTLCKLCNTQLGKKEQLDFNYEVKELYYEFHL
ncbi:HNH endonuclease [Gottfriedia acidiceleris]|uniref:HNH endonuclease n=1 Tax=Gottfriedia acidiceleris TaxID=371036 RepID=UPI003000AEA9